MDVDKILSAAVRFSNFVTARLIFGFITGLFVLPLFGFGLGSANALFSNLPFFEEALKSYQNTIMALGIDDVAIYLIFFVFITMIHVNYVFCVAIGKAVPISLNYQSLGNLEFLIWTDINRVMDGQVTQELRKDIAAAISGISTEIQSLYEDSLSRSLEFFRLAKFTLLAIICIALFTDEFANGELLAGWGWSAFFSVLVLAVVLGARHWIISQNAYSQLVSNARDRVEHVIRGQLADDIARKIDQQISKYYGRFRAHIDWQIPGLGSARVLIETFAEKKRQKMSKGSNEDSK